MSIESEKAHLFVEHLYSNPSLQHYSPLQREDQIGQFLTQNSHTLLPTLASPQFFPGYSWEKIIRLLSRLVRERADRMFAVDMRDLVSHHLDFSFLQEYDIASVNYDQVQEQLLGVIIEILRYSRARQVLSGSYVAVRHNIIARYLRISFSLKRYVHFEFTKVQKLQLSVDHLWDLIKLVLLLMPIVWVFVEKEFPESSAHISVANVPENVLTRAREYLAERITLLPESILQSAIDANISFVDNKNIDATSRVAAIFSARCRNYHPSMRVDRGAESADKSWLHIATRNHKFYGFDVKMLDEFYRIASEERW